MYPNKEQTSLVGNGLNSRNSATECVQPPAPDTLIGSLSELHSNLDMLEKETIELGEKLAPICFHEPAPCQDKNCKPPISGTPIVNRIQEAQERVRSLSISIRQLRQASRI